MDDKHNNDWKPYEVQPPHGFTPHTSENGETLPNCCQRHKNIFERAKKWANSNALVDDAIKFSLKTTLQVAYTEHCILTNISHENGYDTIADFIEYNVFSFGSPKDYQSYIFSLFEFMTPDTPGDRRFPYEASTRLDGLIIMWYKASLMETDIYTFSILYKKWYNIFPFEMSIFKGIKEKYDFFVEILIDDFGGCTHELFVEALNALTSDILTHINTLTLHEENRLDEPSKVKMELIVSKRRLKLEQGYTKDTLNKPEDYYRILRKWFKDEKKFIDEISHLIKPSKANQEKMIDEEIEGIWAQLCAYKFLEFLQSKGISESLVKGLLLKHKGEEFVTYCIALLHEIGFEKYFFENHCKNKEDGFKKLSQLFGVSSRNIKGNINVLSPMSKEDETRYTSCTHLSTISKELQGV